MSELRNSPDLGDRRPSWPPPEEKLDESIASRFLMSARRLAGALPRRLLGSRHGTGCAERHHFREITGDLPKDAPRPFLFMLCLEGDRALSCGIPMRAGLGAAACDQGSLGRESTDGSGRCR